MNLTFTHNHRDDVRGDKVDELEIYVMSHVGLRNELRASLVLIRW